MKQKLIFFFTACLLSFTTQAQTPETEPNNTSTDAGVQTITSDGSYSGNFSFTDLEYYRIAPNTGGTITVTFTNAPVANGIFLAPYPSGSTLANTSNPGSFTYVLNPLSNYMLYTGTGTATGNWKFTISGLSPVSASVAGNNVLCYGESNGTATVAASGAAPFTYSWSPSGGTSTIATGLVAGNYSVMVTNAAGISVTKTISISQPSAITTTTAATNIVCNGGSNGSATVTASGGTGAYTYTWAPSGGTGATASGLAAGIYTCTITDANSCKKTAVLTVTQPNTLTTSVTATSILCNGGIASVTVSASGGTISYIGTGTFTATAGIKTFTVTDANNCSATTSITVTEPTALNVNSSASTILCHGGVSTITVSATDGTSPYTGVGTYTTTAGIMSYTVTDNNGCNATTSVSVAEPTALHVSSSASYSAICLGEIATVTVTAVDGISPYTGTGTYTLNSSDSYTVTDANGCSGTANITLTINSLPTLAAVSNNSLLCTGQTATLSATGAASYTWSTSENIPDIAITPTIQTTYTVNGTDVNGCKNSATVIQDVSLCTGLSSADLNDSQIINLYPNPSTGLFFIELNSKSHIIIINAIGELIVSETMEAGKHNLNIHNQATGIYFVNVTIDSKQHTFKLIKQ